MKAVTIAGLGWLGLPLADLFIHKGYSVAGTTTRAEKRDKIANTSLSVALFDLYQSQTCTLPNDYFNNSTLILNIPPGRQNFNPTVYSNKMCALIDHAMAQGLKQLVFISTTSVFGITTGIITNNTPVAPNTASALAHVEIESHIFKHYKDRACIVRPSGLIGPNPQLVKSEEITFRHPVFSLSKKEALDSGENPVNLIHQADLLKAIAVIVDEALCGKTYNLSAIEHPNRREYYTWCAEQLGLPQPKFSKAKHDPQRLVKSAMVQKVIQASDTLADLGICLAYPSPYDMLPA